MIPFARISKYGNVVDNNRIIKIDNNVAAGVMFLTSSGDLYGFGLNTAYQLGLGHNNNVSTVTLLYQNVKDFWTAGGDSVLQTNDNRFYAAGVGNIIGATNTSRQSWTDITNVFSAVDISDIKKVDIKANCLAVLTNSGNLYCAGYNGFMAYNPSTTLRYANLTLVRSDVLDIKGNYNLGLFTLRTDGKIYGGGYNTSGQMGSSSSSDSQNPNTVVYNSSITGSDLWSYSNLDCLYTFRTGTFLNNAKLVTGTDTSLKMRVSGTGTNGSLAGVTGKWTGFQTAWGSGNTLQAEDVILGYDSSANTTSPILRTSTGLWVCGNNENGQLGIGSVNNQVLYNRNTDLDSIVLDYNKLTLVSPSFYCTYIVYDNKLYGCGAVGVANTGIYLPGYSTGQVNFVQIDLPF